MYKDIDTSIMAGIVLYNPDIERLKDNVIAIYNQVNLLYFFDNGSKNIRDIKRLLLEFSNIKLVQSNENVGVAKALNTLAVYAEKEGYDWIVTLDQDSVAPANLIAAYRKYAGMEGVGMLCCKIIDRNFGERVYDKGHGKGVEFVSLCITSASAVNINIWKKVGGFCEEMFVDAVDFDICMSLCEQGYKILKVNNVKLLHEVGHSRKVFLLGKEELIFNHSPLRCYYMIRNNFLLGRRHHQLLRQMGLAVKRILLINIYETNRWNKNKMMFQGIFHALIGKYGKYD